VGSVGSVESNPPEVEGVTNTYSFSSNHVATRIVIPNPEFKIFGTPKFESLAKAQFESLTINSKYMVDTNLYELKEVFKDFPAAMNSHFLYSGIYQVAVTTCTLEEVRQLIFNTRYQAMRDLDETNKRKIEELLKSEGFCLKKFLTISKVYQQITKISFLKKVEGGTYVVDISDKKIKNKNLFFK
jgi:hypothetical protein